MVAEAEAIDEPEVFAEPEAMVAAEAISEPEVFAEPEADRVTEPEVVAAEIAAAAALTVEPEVAFEPEAVAEPETPAEPTRPVEDVIAQPTWQTYAPDTTADPGRALSRSRAVDAGCRVRCRPDRRAAVADPAAMAGRRSASAGLPFLNRPPTPTGGVEALWAASAREVVAPPAVPGRPVAGAVQPCLSCGLSLSATARFCRRCGTPQAV